MFQQSHVSMYRNQTEAEVAASSSDLGPVKVLLLTRMFDNMTKIYSSDSKLLPPVFQKSRCGPARGKSPAKKRDSWGTSSVTLAASAQPTSICRPTKRKFRATPFNLWGGAGVFCHRQNSFF